MLTPDLAEADRFYSDVLGLILLGRVSNQLVFTGRDRAPRFSVR
jgi:catechol 2,3-dioxygenase-like lactoylglutathione lyase family enzyme